MKLFGDDFAQFEGGPFDGRRLFLVKQADVMKRWPPPASFTFSGTKYERVSYSGITDEQREGMTHVCRGALYRVSQP